MYNMIAYITELTDDNHDSFIQDNSLSLVDIKADWCGPCKQLSPILDKLSADLQGKLVVGKLDADKNPATVEKLGVRSIPSLFLYKNGKQVEKLTGMQTYQKLNDLVSKYM
jgi:thioredoxin 1